MVLLTKLSYNGYPVAMVSNQLAWDLTKGFPEGEIDLKLQVEEPKCECGSEIAHNVKPYHPGHSEWCPVAEAK